MNLRFGRTFAVARRGAALAILVGTTLCGCRVRLLEDSQTAESTAREPNPETPEAWHHDTTPFPYRPPPATPWIDPLPADAGTPEHVAAVAHVGPRRGAPARDHDAGYPVAQGTHPQTSTNSTAAVVSTSALTNATAPLAPTEGQP